MPRKMMDSTMIPQPGEIWTADIPFTSGTASKLRPVLVLWTDAADVVVAAVTSAPSRSATDVALQNWLAAGLRVASTVRLSRLDCLEQNLLRRRLGMVDQRDAGQLKQVWANKIRLRF
jgi:mRNA interferase MazF